MNKQPVNESFGASAANNRLFNVVYRTYIDSELNRILWGIYFMHIGPTFSCYRC